MGRNRAWGCAPCRLLLTFGLDALLLESDFGFLCL